MIIIPLIYGETTVDYLVPKGFGVQCLIMFPIDPCLNSKIKKKI